MNDDDKDDILDESESDGQTSMPSTSMPSTSMPSTDLHSTDLPSTAKGSGGLTFEPPSAPPQSNVDFAFAPGLESDVSTKPGRLFADVTEPLTPVPTHDRDLARRALKKSGESQRGQMSAPSWNSLALPSLGDKKKAPYVLAKKAIARMLAGETPQELSIDAGDVEEVGTSDGSPTPNKAQPLNVFSALNEAQPEIGLSDKTEEILDEELLAAAQMRAAPDPISILSEAAVSEESEMPADAPAFVTLPDMAAIGDDVIGVKLAAKIAGISRDESERGDTLGAFSIGPAVMRKPVDVATPRAQGQDFGGSREGAPSKSQDRLESLVDTMLVGQQDDEPGEVHLQFKDDVLRGLYVSLVKDGDALVAKFIVSDATIRRQIEGHAASLVSRLRDRGMKVSGYVVETRDGGDAHERANVHDDDGYEGF